MTEQLQEIGGRLIALREICDMDIAALAEKTGVSEADLTAYEAGEKDFSFSFLHNAAKALGVDVVDLMSGDSPKLTSCCLTRAGGGYAIDRRAAYNYRHLAFTFRNKLAEPFMVTVEPKPDDPELHAHDGQEFNYLIEGKMRFFIGAQVYDLSPGDSIYFDSKHPHAMRALDGAAARFLAVVVDS